MRGQDEETGLRCIVNSSGCIGTPCESDLLLILTQVRLNNSHNGITGLLSFDGGDFLQLIEGLEAAVRVTMQHITTGSRHHSRVGDVGCVHYGSVICQLDDGFCCRGSPVPFGYKRIPASGQHI